jgi:hypothetical protein
MCNVCRFLESWRDLPFPWEFLRSGEEHMLAEMAKALKMNLGRK